jgi:hypothetical protein
MCFILFSLGVILKGHLPIDSILNKDEIVKDKSAKTESIYPELCHRTTYLSDLLEFTLMNFFFAPH